MFKFGQNLRPTLIPKAFCPAAVGVLIAYALYGGMTAGSMFIVISSLISKSCIYANTLASITCRRYTAAVATTE